MIGAAGVLTEVSPAGYTPTPGLVNLGLRLTTAAQTRQVEWPAVPAIVGQAVDELRREPIPTTGADDTGGGDGGALERALTDTERHPADTTAIRRLVDEMTAAGGGRLGQIVLEPAPPYLS